ncbi:MAG TPA: MFS transporter [Rhizomicrobium sp.]|nr:MFS transporter [Rhizomicrobium sp.]
MRLWAAQTVSSFGARIAREGFAMAAILSIHARPDQLGLLAALAFAPSMIVGLVAGGFVDRTSRRSIMIACDLARTAMILTIPIAAWFGVLTMNQLYVIALVVGGANVLFAIADHAFLPSLVQNSEIIEGNTKMGITESVAEIGGPALAGTLFQLFTAPFAMLFTAITYLISAAFLFAIPATNSPETQKGRPAGWYRDLRTALAAVLEQPLVRPLLWMSLMPFGAFFSGLYMIYGLKVLGLSPALLGVIIAMGGIGAMAGAGLSARLCQAIGVGPTILVCVFASAIFIVPVPLASGPLWLKVALLTIAQLGGDAFGVAALIPIASLRQSVFPPKILGRTAALFSATGGVAAIVGALVGGWLGSTIGVRPTLWVASAAYLLTPLFVLFSPLRKLGSIEDAVAALSSPAKSPEAPASAS